MARPSDQAGAQHSQSPIIAEAGAVMVRTVRQLDGWLCTKVNLTQIVIGRAGQLAAALEKGGRP